MATTNFPTSLDTISSLPNPGSGDFTTAPSHASQHDVENDALRAIEAKVGIGTSTPTANKVLRATGTGTTAYAQVGLTTDVTGTLPVANGGTGITSLGSGVATFLGTPSSANLASAITDETGTGVLVFNNTPTIIGGGSWAGSPTITSPLLISPTESGTVSGWIDGLPFPSSVTYNGNRSYSLVFSGTDYTSTISPGMRLKTTRSVAAPTQCTSLNGSTQYYSKSSPAGMTFTDDFVVSAWVKLSSYATGGIVSRYNGTSGWEFHVTATGQVRLQGNSGSSTNTSYVESYQSLPLNKWVHVAAQLDMSAFTATTTTSYIMFNGVDIPASVNRGGTNPTALIQAGNLEVGTYNAGAFFPGKIAQAFVTSAKITQANARTIYSQGITSSDISALSIISAYSFNNSINDLNTTNANNLTANGSAVATNTDSPFCGQASGLVNGSTDFCSVESCTFSTDTTMTVRTSEICTIPTSGGISSTSYSGNSAPYGLPGDLGSIIGRRLAYIPVNASYTTTSTTGAQFQPVTNYSVTIPQNCYEIKIGFINSSFSSGSTAVLKVYNGAINTIANELVQFNYSASNSGLSVSAPVPVVPGEVLSLNVGWLTTSGTLTWSGGGANRQAPAFWVETA